MSSSYESLEDHRAVRSRGRHSALQHENDGQTDYMLRPFMLRARYGAGAVLALGAMLLGYVLGSRGEGMRGDGAAAGAPVSDSYYQGEMLAETIGDEEPLHVLSLQARNEYGVFRELALYGMDMLVEPHKESILSVSGRSGTTTTEQGGQGHPFSKLSTGGGERRSSQEAPLEAAPTKLHWVLTPLDTNGDALPLASPILDVVTDGSGGVGDNLVDGPTVMLTEAGSLSLLTVTEMLEDGSVVGEGRATVSCRYVRRELRTLTYEDREAFMDAMVVFYTAPDETDAGSESLTFDNYQYFAEVHDSHIFCYHDGMMFLTAHLAFDWAMERALQRTNPAVSLAFWDYTIESGTVGAGWPESMIFGSDMFGSSLGSADNGFMISDGRFANVSSIYDPDSVLVAPIISPIHNPYGYISASYDFQDVPKLSRTRSFCGFTGTSSFPTCEDIIDCFEDNDTIHGWSQCLERNVHANMHGWLGGAWGCKADTGVFQSENPVYTDDLLVFIMEYVTANQWPTNGIFSDYNECDTSCERGSDEPCGCTCLIDPDTMTDDEVYAVLEAAIITSSSLYSGSDFVSYDSSKKYPYTFMQDGVPLEDDDLFLLLRHIITVGCAPAYVGAMTTAGSSPIDPLFWTLHPNFERALHVLWLSPQYKDKYDFTWLDGTCFGSALEDVLPFSEHDLGQGNSTSYLTNEDLLRMAHPSNRMLPYVYDNFQTWGTCTNWDPASESTDEA